jgi:hypothetical protein
MKKISAEIIADSTDGRGNRITTMLLTFPRFILPELNTHRMLSKNSASSRAIPFEKMVKMVEEDPFIPIAWQKDHKGMQGTEYLPENPYRLESWLKARDAAVKYAKELNGWYGVSKQIVNRLLEPYMWHTVLVTATEFENFFEQRCPKYRNIITGVNFKSKKDWINFYLDNGGANTNLNSDDVEYWRSINTSQAEIHIQALAESMWEQLQESIPRKLLLGKYHVPFFEIEED